MAQLNLQTFFQFIGQQAAAVYAAGLANADFTVGSVLRAFTEAVSSVSLFLQAQNILNLQTARLNTSSGTDVDTYVNPFGLTRLPAIAATGSVTFTRLSTQLSALLPVGATIQTADGTQQFTVIEDTTNSAWNASLNGYFINPGVATLTVTVQAVNSGSQGNILANTLTSIQTDIPFDYVTNPAGFTNGQNQESDAQVQLQFPNYINTRSLSTPLAIQYAAESVQAGVTAYVAENVDTMGNFRPGFFVVTVDNGTGSPPSSLITAVSAAVNATRGATISYAVQPPTVISAVVALTITVAAGYVKATLQPLVQAAITAYIDALPVGSPFPYSQIANIAYNTSPGISNVTAVTLNGVTADLGGGPSQAVRVGSVIVN